MQTKTNLKIDWATHEAAKYACENWHYSKCLPINKLLKIGVWEDNKYIGVIIFSCGAAPYLGKSYGLNKQEVCELTRIALNNSHSNYVSRMMAIALKFLKKSNPGLKLVVSFADPRQNHHGGIYQATNWIYTGISEAGGPLEYWINGKWSHARTAREKFGITGKILTEKYGIKTRPYCRKHRYLMPLDNEMKQQLQRLRKPYPKRATSKDNVASGFQSEEGGAIPTVALQNISNKNDGEAING